MAAPARRIVSFSGTPWFFLLRVFT